MDDPDGLEDVFVLSEYQTVKNEKHQVAGEEKGKTKAYPEFRSSLRMHYLLLLKLLNKMSSREQ